MNALSWLLLQFYYFILFPTGACHRIHAINVAQVAAARFGGFGNAAARRFCAFMNLNSPISEFVKIQDQILHEGFSKRANASMKRAIDECDEAGGSHKKMRASFDGTWMKRGRTSKVGIVAAIGPNNKVVGLEVLHKNCPTCKGKKPCKLGDKCRINHQGTSGAMEPAGAVSIIKRIYQETGVKITEYLGDGDSRGFAKAQSEVDWEIKKLECTNHVTKRPGARLRKRKIEKKDVQLSIGRKGIGGRGLLTDEKINKIQQYYGYIIRSNLGDVAQMQRYIMAMYKHIASTDEHPDHDDCDPKVCKFLLAKAKNEPYSHKDRRHFHIAPEVMAHVKDIFVDLAKTDLLEKCAHGMTQNSNECFNSTVWNLLSKNGFANRKLTELSANIALCIFNEGYLPLLDVLSSLGVPVGAELANAPTSTMSKTTLLF
jgi:hypothetical protein